MTATTTCAAGRETTRSTAVRRATSIFAERGVDTEYGGDGNDDLWAMARADVERKDGEPADTLNGENGNDRFHVRDGEADTVNCGAGFDRVFADRTDQVERTARRSSAAAQAG